MGKEGSRGRGGDTERGGAREECGERDERGQKGRGKGQEAPPCHWSLPIRIHLETGRQGSEVTKT